MSILLQSMHASTARLGSVDPADVPGGARIDRRGHWRTGVCAAALSVLDVVAEPGFLPAMAARAERWRAGLEALARREGGPPTSGQGLLLALELPQPGRAQRLADALRDRPGHGMLVNAVRPERLRLMPALNASDEELGLALSLLDEALGTAA